MPLPWGPPGPRQRIPDVAERAVTLKQLRELRTFLQRLTKTGLLRNTTAFSRQNGTFEQPILWETINLYQITDEVIKKVIPYVDPGGEKDPGGTKRRWYSWSEFVAPKRQPAKIMFSHWWGGRFKDFMATVDKLAVDRSLSINTAIWICTFANCQFGEDFGAMLKDCPFMRALRTVDLTVLVVDSFGGSLTRSWCGLEVQYTTEHEMEFQLYTSAGRVGSSFVSGGPLVEAVKSWDIRKSEASDPPYRRQILNYVAGVDELEGLKKDGDRNMEVDDMGRPQLQDGAEEARDPLLRMLNGEQEYSYESALFQKQARRFEDLNMMVRLSVMRHLDIGRRTSGCTVPRIAARGITLSQLRIITRKLEASCPWEPGTCPWWQHDQPAWDEFESLSFKDLNFYTILAWVEHQTAERQCSYMELVADGPQVPQFFVENVWTHAWAKKMDCLELFAEVQQLPDSAIFWIDLFCLNQHKVHDEFGQFMDGSVNTECESIINIVTDNEAELERGWPWAGVSQQVQAGKSVYLATRTGILACNRPFANGAWVSGRVDVRTIRMIAMLDLNQLKFSVASDKAHVHAMMQGSPDSSPGSMEDGIARFGARLRCWCAGPLLREAALEDDAALIESVCAWSGLRLNSDTMKGGLGETPLHIAAACGSSSALRALLRAGMDPNIEDDIKERPLHYAALAGRHDVARELLAARADPWAESAYAETPLQVAKQGPAAFLGVDARGVVELLSEAQHCPAVSCDLREVARRHCAAGAAQLTL